VLFPSLAQHKHDDHRNHCQNGNSHNDCNPNPALPCSSHDALLESKDVLIVDDALVYHKQWSLVFMCMPVIDIGHMFVIVRSLLMLMLMGMAL
jgi:hypothetical protein